ncbi:MAG: family 43 glycosylhydrolase [Syntrophaceae bacterium]|nr:family 43 glycosylhydrolase [Syntrophaceae bacterium]
MSQNTFPIGPFTDYEKNPILRPSRGFQSKRLYNPSVLKEGERFLMVYRAETDDGLTGRIGLAESQDGFHFTCHEEPVLTPGEDFDRGGCEDPRIVKLDGVYYLTYVGNSQRYHVSNICIATSKDLLNWRKLGSVLPPRPKGWNSGQLKAGVIVPEKIDGKYVMYFMGEERPWTSAIGIACSEDLLHWIEPLEGPILSPRPGYFDSQGIEPGPTPVVLNEGILLIYNGWGSDCIYRPSGALFSKEDPAKLLWRADQPLLELSRDYGGQFGEGNHCVAEGLVKVENQWLLYYGAADRFTCLATWKEASR